MPLAGIVVILPLKQKSAQNVADKKNIHYLCSVS
jgi:hypothetical protein